MLKYSLDSLRIFVYQLLFILGIFVSARAGLVTYILTFNLIFLLQP